MFFDSPAEIPTLAKSFGFTLFILPPDAINPSITLKNLKQPVQHPLEKLFPKNSTLTIPVNPEKNRIGVDEIREISEKITTKATKNRFILVLNAKTLTDSAENALLKSLEEPKLNYHFVIFTTTTESLLPTILSRAEIFYLRTLNVLENPVLGDEKQKALARELLTANPDELINLSNQLSDKKHSKSPREDALKIVALAIEIAEKSYFATKNSAYLKKLEKLLTLSDNLEKGGHLKLHILADLL